MLHYSVSLFNFPSVFVILLFTKSAAWQQCWSLFLFFVYVAYCACKCAEIDKKQFVLAHII